MNEPTPARRRPDRNQADPAGTATRRSALRMLDAVLRRGEPLDLASHAAAQGLAPPDRAFAVAIASETLRWMVDIDILIDQATPQPLADDVKARTVLRLSLAQLLILKTPPHAVVATALPLVAGGPRRLVHAILSRAQKEQWKLPDRAALPSHVAERWQVQWGDAMIADAEAAWSKPPPVDLSFVSQAAADSFDDGTALYAAHRRLPRGDRIEDVAGFTGGNWWVQDLAASIAAHLLGAGKGKTVLDLCAAPGGKTMQLAAAGWKTTAVDSSAKRLQRLERNLKRTGLQATIAQGDLRQWQPELPADGVLLDAPCSATGIFRRHPDVLHRIEPTDIWQLSDLQHQLLGRAASWVKASGMLVYSTCSLEQVEGEKQIDRFLDEHPGWTIDAVVQEELPVGVAPDAKGQVRILPGMLADSGGLDGFFIARLKAPSA